MLAPQCLHLPCIRRDLPVAFLPLGVSNRGRGNRSALALMLDVATGGEFVARPERPHLRLVFPYLEVPRASLRVVTGVFCRETTLGAAPCNAGRVMKYSVRHRTIAVAIREPREASELSRRQPSQRHQQPASAQPDREFRVSYAGTW